MMSSHSGWETDRGEAGAWLGALDAWWMDTKFWFLIFVFEKVRDG
jgi:hypothetical protein